MKETFITWLLATKVKSPQPRAEEAKAHLIDIINIRAMKGVKIATYGDLLDNPMRGIGYEELVFLFKVYKRYIRLLAGFTILEHIKQRKQSETFNVQDHLDQIACEKEITRYEFKLH